MKFTIQNNGVQSIMTSASTEFSIYMLPPTQTTIVADMVRDELIANYGSTIISTVGTSGAEDYAAPIYAEYTATTSWVLKDLGAYRTNFTFHNNDNTNNVFISFSGFSGTTGSISLVVNAAGKTFTRASGSFLNDGFTVGRQITTTGFVASAGANNQTLTITTATDLVITCSAAVGLVNETHAATMAITAPPSELTMTVTGEPAVGTSISHYNLKINRTMNPERYFYMKCTAGAPVLQVLAV